MSLRKPFPQDVYSDPRPVDVFVRLALSQLRSSPPMADIHLPTEFLDHVVREMKKAFAGLTVMVLGKEAGQARVLMYIVPPEEEKVR